MLTTGVTNGLPVPTCVPPEAASYHLSVPVQPVAERLIVPGPQREFAMPLGTDGIAFIVAVTADLLLSQPDALVQDT